jgi:hypothetical protein
VVGWWAGAGAEGEQTKANGPSPRRPASPSAVGGLHGHHVAHRQGQLVEQLTTRPSLRRNQAGKGGHPGIQPAARDLGVDNVLGQRPTSPTVYTPGRKKPLAPPAPFRYTATMPKARKTTTKKPVVNPHRAKLAANLTKARAVLAAKRKAEKKGTSPQRIAPSTASLVAGLLARADELEGEAAQLRAAARLLAP